MYLGGISERSTSTPDAIAVTDGTITLSWARLADSVRGVAGHLARLPAGVRLGVSGENAVPTLVAHVAGLVSGVGTVAIHRQATPAELTHELKTADCRAMLVGPSGVDAAAAAVAGGVVETAVAHGIDDPPAGFLEWGQWSSGSPVDVDLAARPARPLMVYTSGTTGRPSATEAHWLPPQRATTAMQYLQQLAKGSSFPPGPHLVVGPLQHNGPLTSVRHLVAGEPVVVMPRFGPREALTLIARHGITSSVMVPTHFSRLLSLPADVRRVGDVSSLKTLAHTGSACPREVKQAMIDWVGPILVESYGGSELGTVARISSQDWQRHPGSVGKAVPPLRIAAFDGIGNELEPGEIGVLGVELNDGRVLQFHGNAEKSRNAYVKPGVATLGDVGYVDASGFVYITDRLTDVVISGGVNLYPAECENVLITHPGIHEVAVIGVPDPDMGEALHALVVATGLPLDLEELGAWCRRELAGFKCPRTYEFVPQLPRNEMGKVNKRSLKASYWDSRRTISG
ncbi:AMP-binding protein [Mycobacterium sp. AZCC_0083]|uniref:AMP-binding protein n=1 Tax=Mycobacterium sp. AZCC_0083 TaxID=2735882 RepID=UPI00160C8504|nr:AMP-binding protein [Mycobacterium sp. AZCC_0083]MBB5164012.1 long-chain acyl-CoA synthetase [Mycobacterium sp. AZCC_0083]